MKLNAILLVDDNDVDNFIHQRVIGLVNFSQQVYSCTSARSAKELIAQLQEQENPLPEMIFLDLNMPGENGFEFLDWFVTLPQSLQDSVKVVILTSSNNNADIQKIKDFPFVVKFITKPLKKEDLALLATL